MFGGNGSDTSKKILKQFKKSKHQIQSIVMCGSNDNLRRELESYDNCLAVGFTEHVPDYMRLADFFIGKPGPGCLSEAIHMGLPVITQKNFATLPQERYNAKWIENHKLGLVVSNYNQISDAVDKLLSGNKLEYFKANANSLNNRALFEIPVFLEQIMHREQALKNYNKFFALKK